MNGPIERGPIERCMECAGVIYPNPSHPHPTVQVARWIHASDVDDADGHEAKRERTTWTGDTESPGGGS